MSRLFGSWSVDFGVGVLIVLLALGGIAQNFVGITDLGKYHSGLLLTLFSGLFVRVVFQSKLAVGGLDLLLSRLLWNTKNRVGIVRVFHSQ